MAATEKKTLTKEEKKEIDETEVVQQQMIKEQLAEFPITRA
ncbi:hypothetical protein ACLJJ6_02090 [Pediococcus siamensis]